MVAAIVAVIGFVGFTAFKGGDDERRQQVAEGSTPTAGKPPRPPQDRQAHADPEARAVRQRHRGRARATR